MRKKYTSVTIGIPAYNEEYNISSLLSCLLKQKQTSFYLKKIIIFSDGSTDNTVSIVRKRTNSKILLIKGLKRSGVAKAQNAIISETNSDILVLLNADIFIKDKLFIERLIKPIINQSADLTSSALHEISPKNFFEKIIVESMHWKKCMFESYHNGVNIFLCHGPARAFSKKMYSNLFFPTSVAEDAYVYLLGLSKDFSFKYVRSAKAYYKAPDTLKDHEKQSVRFMKSKEFLEHYFEKDFVDKNYELPKFLVISSFFNYFIKSPFTMSLYVGILMYIKIKSFFFVQPELWDIALSSKINL